MPLPALQLIERKFEQHKRLLELKRGELEREIERRIQSFEARKGALARTMASYIDASRPCPIIELGPGTGPVTEALVAQGVDSSRLVLVEFAPTFCRLLRARYPAATVMQGDAYSLKSLLAGLLQQ